MGAPKYIHVYIFSKRALYAFLRKVKSSYTSAAKWSIVYIMNMQRLRARIYVTVPRESRTGALFRLLMPPACMYVSGYSVRGKMSLGIFLPRVYEPRFQWTLARVRALAS